MWHFESEPSVKRQLPFCSPALSSPASASSFSASVRPPSCTWPALLASERVGAGRVPAGLCSERQREAGQSQVVLREKLGTSSYKLHAKQAMSIKVRLASFISRLKTRQFNLKSGCVSPAVVIPVVCAPFPTTLCCDQSLSKQQDLSTVDMCGLPPPTSSSEEGVSESHLCSVLVIRAHRLHSHLLPSDLHECQWIICQLSGDSKEFICWKKKKKKNPILRIIRPSCVNFSLTQLRWHNAHRISPRKVRTGHRRRQLPSLNTAWEQACCR